MIPSADLKWFFNRKEIQTSESIKIATDHHRSKLIITGVTNDNVGFYSCKATNEIGEADTLGKLEILRHNNRRITKVYRPKNLLTRHWKITR